MKDSGYIGYQYKDFEINVRYLYKKLKLKHLESLISKYKIDQVCRYLQ